MLLIITIDVNFSLLIAGVCCNSGGGAGEPTVSRRPHLLDLMNLLTPDENVSAVVKAMPVNRPEKSPDVSQKLLDTMNTVGKSLSPGGQVHNAGKALANAAQGLGKALINENAIKNTGKALTETVSSLGQTLVNGDALKTAKALMDKLNSGLVSDKAKIMLMNTLLQMEKENDGQKRMRRSLDIDDISLGISLDGDLLGGSYSSSLETEIVGDSSILEASIEKQITLRAEDLSLDEDVFFRDWPSDVNDRSQLGPILQMEYERLMGEIEAINEEEGISENGVGEKIISFEEFKAEILGEKK